MQSARFIQDEAARVSQQSDDDGRDQYGRKPLLAHERWMRNDQDRRRRTELRPRAAWATLPGGMPSGSRRLAYRWLVANPATGIPDRLISMQLTEGQTIDRSAVLFRRHARTRWRGDSRSEVRLERNGSDGRRRLPFCLRRLGRRCIAARAMRRFRRHLLPAIRSICTSTKSTTAKRLRASTRARRLRKFTSSWFKNDPSRRIVTSSRSQAER